MPVTFTPDCFDPSDPVDPPMDSDDWDPETATGHHADGWEADPQFRVETTAVEQAADALLVAAGRFMRVGMSGTEYSEQWMGDERDDHTPNNARVRVDAEAAYLTADTKGGLPHEMAASMKRILAEELTRAGVSAVVSPDYNPIRAIGAEPWPRS